MDTSDMPQYLKVMVIIDMKYDGIIEMMNMKTDNTPPDVPAGYDRVEVFHDIREGTEYWVAVRDGYSIDKCIGIVNRSNWKQNSRSS